MHAYAVQTPKSQSIAQHTLMHYICRHDVAPDVVGVRFPTHNIVCAWDQIDGMQDNKIIIHNFPPGNPFQWLANLLMLGQ